MIKKGKLLIFSIIALSIFIHLAVLIVPISSFSSRDIELFSIKNKPKVLKIRRIGVENAPESKNITFRKKTEQKGQDLATKPDLKNLAFKELPFGKTPSEKEKEVSKSLKTSANAFKRLNPQSSQLGLESEKVKDFLKTPSPGYISSTQALKSLGQSDLNFGLEIPKGISESELNKRELVFYGFQKRIAQGYVNSFQKELNLFERQNPHKTFPMTSEKKTLAGRVIYDMNGDILRIQTQRLEDIAELKTFFLNVLNNMSSLPNPPEEIIENDQFAINFVLILNN